jgi:anaerobic magnesium-protoporphyrin IX monomethyl ester cyclase
MHITLINPPQFFTKAHVAAGIVPPLGVMYIGAACRQKGYSVQLIDAVVEAPEKVTKLGEDIFCRGMTFEQISDAIDINTKIVGISNLFSFAFPIVLGLARKIKKDHPDIKIAVGGAHPSATPIQTMENREFDFVVISEGENSFVELCKSIEDGNDFRHNSIDGLAYRENGATKINPKMNFIEELDTIPFPARDMLPHDKYSSLHEGHGPIQEKCTTILSSRGCPFKCAFCTPKLWQFRYRTRSAKNVVDEIEHCVNEYNVTEFHFEDENLTVNKQRALDICSEIKRRNLKIKWQTPNGIRASVTDVEILSAMKEAGCYHITVAPESGSKRVLEHIYHKKQDLKQIAEIVSAASNLGLKTAAYFIIGAPGERAGDVESTIRYAKHLARKGLDEVAFALFVPLPGSELYDVLKKQGKLPDTWVALATTSDMAKTCSWSEYINDKQLRTFRIRAYLAFHMTKLCFHPLKAMNMIFNILRMRETLKTERVILTFIRRYLRVTGIF